MAGKSRTGLPKYSKHPRAFGHVKHDEMSWVQIATRQTPLPIAEKNLRESHFIVPRGKIFHDFQRISGSLVQGFLRSVCHFKSEEGPGNEIALPWYHQAAR